MTGRWRKAIRVGLMVLLCLPLLTCALHVTLRDTAPIPSKPPGTLRIASHNLHYILVNQADGAWSLADWHGRKAALDAAFKAVDADILAAQETESFAGGSVSLRNLALDHLLDRNPDYAAAAVGDPRSFPSTQPIFYRRDRLRLADEGWFFFSETPEVIYSRTFDGSYPAFASWAAFELRATGQPLTVFNVHYEYSSRSNRLRAARLTAKRMAPALASGDAVFLAGDLNARRGARTLAIHEDSGLSFAPLDGATYHFNRGLNLFGAIDHIAAANGATRVGPPIIVQQRFAGTWPSDHYPVFADYRLPGP